LVRGAPQGLIFINLCFCSLFINRRKKSAALERADDDDDDDR